MAGGPWDVSDGLSEAHGRTGQSDAAVFKKDNQVLFIIMKDAKSGVTCMFCWA